MRERAASHAFISSLLVVCLLPGCGGGGSDGLAATRTTPVKLSISWAARSRFINPPASALSVVVRLQGAHPDGGDFVVTINRRADPAAYVQSLTTSNQAKVGTWLVRASFFAQPDGGGSLVGSAGAWVIVNPDGSGIEFLATSGAIAAVEVVRDQSILVGQAKDVAFTARGANGSIIAVSPGSAFFEIVSGSDRLQVNSAGTATGLRPGPATVRATVDGIVSAAQIISVTSNAAVSIDPSEAVLSIRASRQFSASVTDAPDQSVAWSVQGGPSGGSITVSGVYTAPGLPGTYHIVAVSRYDPSKQATAAVTVQAGGVNIGIQ